MAHPLRGKTLLITGGTGSFGRAVLGSLLDQGLKEIRIFSRDELKQEQMRLEFNHPKVKFMIGDVRSRNSVDAAMQGVDHVFHAAALKQVPSCDFFPMQAVYTNVIGSHNVVESAIAHRVGRVVCLSTDKAVYPVNAMGMTKALMEKVAQAAARTVAGGDTAVLNVRYGNVMYSRGSVIPLFVGQIKKGGPITVTEPGMTGSCCRWRKRSTWSCSPSAAAGRATSSSARHRRARSPISSRPCRTCSAAGSRST